MGHKMTQEEFVAKAQQVHGLTYDYSQVNYLNSRTKVTITCLKHGPFDQLPSSHLSGNGCLRCAREWTDEHRKNLRRSSRQSRGMTTDEWIARARQVHGDKYNYSKTVYVNQRTDVAIVCPIHGEFTQKADSHIRGFGCRLCGLESDNHKGVHCWSDEQRAKIEQTCLLRYGAKRYLDGDAGRERMAEIRKSTEFQQKLRDINSSEEVLERRRQTCVAKYGVESPMQLKEVRLKNEETKRAHGTWSTSKSEETMYTLLCAAFGNSDVERQYRTELYPFRCDFYIRSLDLFIELNATWLHGGHWFDANCVADLDQVRQWQEQIQTGSHFYQVALDVWTIRDVKKRETALKNKLNYLVFWENDLSDFKQWLDSDHSILCNI